MKKKLLVSVVVLVVAPLLMVGCAAGVSEEEYDEVKSDLDAAQSQIQSLQSDLDAAESQIETLQSDFEAAQAELAALQEIYPPGNFASVADLESWLASNTISDEAPAAYAPAWFRKALRLQQDALVDGYLISADYDYDANTDLYYVWCNTVIGSQIFYWDPESDEVFEEFGLSA